MHAAQPGHGVADDLAGVEPHIQRNLVVARPPGVQPPRRRADELVQPPLDVHVQVFQRGIPRKIAGLDFLLDAAQALDDGLRVFLADDALLCQHPGVGYRTGDVLVVQAAVVLNGNSVGGEVVGVFHTLQTIARQDWRLKGWGGMLVASQPRPDGFRVHVQIPDGIAPRLTRGGAFCYAPLSGPIRGQNAVVTNCRLRAHEGALLCSASLSRRN